MKCKKKSSTRRDSNLQSPPEDGVTLPIKPHELPSFFLCASKHPTKKKMSGWAGVGEGRAVVDFVRVVGDMKPSPDLWHQALIIQCWQCWETDLAHIRIYDPTRSFLKHLIFRLHHHLFDLLSAKFRRCVTLSTVFGRSILTWNVDAPGKIGKQATSKKRPNNYRRNFLISCFQTISLSERFRARTGTQAQKINIPSTISGYFSNDFPNKTS